MVQISIFKIVKCFTIWIIYLMSFFLRNPVYAQDTLKPIYEGPTLYNFNWTADSSTLFFVDVSLGTSENPIPEDEGWVLYDGKTQELSRSKHRPFAPSITLEEMRKLDFATDDFGRIQYSFYPSPDNRFIAYKGQGSGDKNLSSELGRSLYIANVAGGKYIDTGLLTSLILDVHWSRESTAFTIDMVVSSGSILVQYCSDLNESLAGVACRMLNQVTVADARHYVDQSYDISNDGMQLLLDGYGSTILWDAREEQKSRNLGFTTPCAVGGTSFYLTTAQILYVKAGQIVKREIDEQSNNEVVVRDFPFPINKVCRVVFSPNREKLAIIINSESESQRLQQLLYMLDIPSITG